jgi:hypothetical protein
MYQMSIDLALNCSGKDYYVGESRRVKVQLDTDSSTLGHMWFRKLADASL